MKSILVYSVCVLFIGHLTMAQETIQLKSLQIQPSFIEEPDSLTYEISIFDPGFNLWMNTVAKPMGYYSQKYLENWNRQYVAEWNYRYCGGINMDIIESMIDYDPNTDYGLELNYQLYEYFQYIEKELHLKLLPRGY